MTTTPVTPPHRSVIKRLSAMLGPIFSIAILGVALWFLHRELAGLSRSALIDQIRSIPLLALFASVAFAACSYTVLTGFDATALKYLKSDIPYRRSALTAFMAYAVGNNVGVAALSGGAIRYRMYTLAGLTATDIARIIIFVTATFVLGACAMFGMALLLMPETQTTLLRIPHQVLQWLGCLLFAVPLAYLASSILRRAPLKLGHWQFPLPRPAIAFTQLGISICDMTFACATLYVLFSAELQMGFFPFLGVYLLALVAGIISSVPGGIGVFEAVLVAALPQLDTAALLGTILVYRLIYYVAPLTLALLLLVGHESRQHAHVLRRSTAQARHFLSGIAPQAMGTAVFLAGVVLLVSGASPAIESRLHLISRMIPLPVLELSHMVGSVVGVGLLILARGLHRRLHSAYLAALAALLTGIGMSLLKGLDYEEALLLAAIAIALWVSRHEFYRQGSVSAQRFPAPWLGAIALVMCLATWVSLVTFHRVDYSNALWWQFALDAEAPRMLRASFIAALMALGFALWAALRKLPMTVLNEDTGAEDENLRQALANAHYAAANIALLGDKRYLWSADRRTFIMYQIRGNSWIAMGDPVGPEEQHEALAWDFRELVDSYNGRVVFYQVSDKSLALYVDLGLALVKIGEDARVSLCGFSLEGSARADLRQARSRATRSGASFEVVPRAMVPAIAADLRRVSDSWLTEKSVAEKGFSLGSFSEPYIANFDCAVVRVDQEIVAFANLWTAPQGGELSVDLMRYDQHAPKSIMDYLFTELMVWGSHQGYQWFSLGMAPLSGLEQRPLAPLWHKMGNLVFTHGESFYNFEGLRKYKEKFSPQWESRYLACPTGWFDLSLALLDVSSLISGGATKLLGRQHHLKDPQ